MVVSYESSYKITTSIIFCLSYDISNELVFALKVDIISTKMHCCHGRRHGALLVPAKVLIHVF